MKAKINNNLIEVRDCYEVKEFIKELPGRRWNKDRLCWTIPLGLDNCFQLKKWGAEFSDELREAANQLYKDINKVRSIKLAETVEPIAPIPLKGINPFQHQIKAYNIALKLKKSALLMEMGTGKTLATVAVTGRLFLDGYIKKVLVCCPKTVVPVWPKEFSYGDFPVKTLPLDGPVKKRKDALKKFQDKDSLLVAIINYESTWRMKKELANWAPDMIIADESQRIKSPSSEQSKQLHHMGATVDYKMILTGTPVQNNPLDFYSQYKFLDPSIFGTVYTAFKARYCTENTFHQVLYYKNMNEFIQKAHSIAYRITKAEALDLPEQVFQNHYCELEPEAKRAYEGLRQMFYAELETGEEISAPIILTRILRLQQITGGFLKDDEGKINKISKAKLNALEEVVSDLILAGKKVVVFAKFLPEIAAIQQTIEKMAECRVITGQVSSNDRAEFIKSFQEEENVKVFIAQLKTAGLGVTLTAADTCIYYSFDYNYGDYSQSLSRIHRIGQKNICTYIHLLASKTIDEKILKALGKKEDLAHNVVDNWRHYLDNTG